MHTIIGGIEPSRLKVIWQAVNSSVRTKFVVGELIRSDDKVSLTYFRLWPDFTQAQSLGFQGHPAFSINTPVHHHNVLEVLSRRLPPRHRADFATYLAKHRLQQVAHLSNFALLGYTGGHLPGDGFSFAIDFLHENLPHQFLMELAGFRYYAGMQVEISSIIGQYVHFQAEDNNPHDPFAVQIFLHGMLIGYVPRYYSLTFRYWLENFNVLGAIERIDGTLTKPQVHCMMHISSTPARPNGYLLRSA